MKISHLIFTSFLFILLLFSIATITNYRQYNRVKDNTDFLTRSTTIVREGNRLHRNLLNMISAGRGYLLTNERSFLVTFDSTSTENTLIYHELAGAVDNPKLLQDVRNIHQLQRIWVRGLRATIQGARDRALTGGTPLTNRLDAQRYVSLDDESNSFKALQAALRKFISEEYERRELQRKVLATSIQTTRVISFSLTALSIVLGLAIAALLAHTLSRRILRMVNLANSIAAGNYAVHLKDEKRDELSKLSSSLDEMARVLAQNFTLLKRKNEELDQYAHIVSHDLKAPLRGISNVVSWIEEDHSAELPPKVHDYLQLIHGRLDRAENLINGLLSYARVGREGFETEETDVHALVRQIVDEESFPATMSIEVSPSLPTFRTQRLPLSQVLTNLVNNAIKYHDKTDGVVKIYSKEGADHYEFFIEDNGPGIAAAHQTKIFRIFQTLQERDSFESTGIGLAIVQKILEARKDQVKVHSQQGQGSIFSFTWKK